LEPGSDGLDLEVLHEWFEAVVDDTFKVFGSASKSVVEGVERVLGHRCTWLIKREDLRRMMRRSYGLVGDVVVTMLFEQALKKSYMLNKDQRDALLRILGDIEEGRLFVGVGEEIQ